jgi:hypothetical protein
MLRIGNLTRQKSVSLGRDLDIKTFEDRIPRSHQVVEIRAILETALFHGTIVSDNFVPCMGAWHNHRRLEG